MPRIALLVITDGRPCLQQTLASAEEFLLPHIDGPTFLVSDSRHELGLSGAVRRGWGRMMNDECDEIEYVFHLEDDFVFRSPVPVAEMVALCERERLAQVALKRGPVNAAEHAHGGFMQANPGNYVQRDGWVESFFGFTLNPCVYPYATTWNVSGEWEGESGLTAALSSHAVPGWWRDPVRFGIFGNLDDPPRCTHIGHERADGWTL